jgi:hypothetical protein
MVALLDSGDTAAWACGRGAWTLVPSGRLPMQAGQFDLRKVDRHPLASVATPVPTVLVVPGMGAHAQDPRIIAARGKGSCVEPLS